MGEEELYQEYELFQYVCLLEGQRCSFGLCFGFTMMFRIMFRMSITPTLSVPFWGGSKQRCILENVEEKSPLPLFSQKRGNKQRCALN